MYHYYNIQVISSRFLTFNNLWYGVHAAYEWSYGRILLKGRLKAKFFTSASKISHALSSPLHHSSFMISENIVEVLSFYKSKWLDRPIAPGICILDLAK